MPAFESGPSIVELFFSAKKLLSLQPRVENREVRKQSSSCQQNARETAKSHHNVLDLLSPLSIDDLKTTPYIRKHKPEAKSISTQATTFAPSVPTPMSIHSPGSPCTKYEDKERASQDQKVNTDTNTSHAPMFKEQYKEQNQPSNLYKGQSNVFSSNVYPQSNSYKSNSYKSNPLFKEQFKSNENLAFFKAKQEAKPEKTECSNCHTQNTPLWRKDPEGNTLCNACGLFYKLHGTTRPLSLKTDVIKKRSSRRSASSISRNGSSTSLATSNPITRIAKAPMSGVPNSSSLPHARYKNVLILPKPTTSPSTTSVNVTGTPTASLSRSIPIPRTTSRSSIASSPVNINNQPFKRKKSDLNLASNADYDFSKRSSVSSAGSASRRNTRRTLSVTSLQSPGVRSSGGFFDAAENDISRCSSVTTMPINDGSLSSHNSFLMRQPASLVDFRRANSGFSNNDDFSSIPVTPLNTTDLLSTSRDVEMEMDATYFQLQRQGVQNEYRSSLSNGLKRSMMSPEKQLKDLDWLKFEL